MRATIVFAEHDDGDNRFERWCKVNGVATIYPFAGRRVRYFRADGSEVTPADSYPYDAVLTPYTDSAGHA